MSTPLYFTPSEVVLLNGEQFAPSASLVNKFTLYHSGQGVKVKDLALACVSAALLSAEQSGIVHLTPSVNKSLFGLVKQPTLLMEPTPVQNTWPAGTLEADLLEMACRLQPSNKNDLYSIIYSWLGRDYGSPFDETVERVGRGLAQRGLFQVVEERKLKIFKVQKLVMPESTRPLIAGQPFAPVQQLMQQCSQFRAEMWSVMQKNIEKAINARTEQQDTSTD